MSQITFQTDSGEGLRFVQTGWDHVHGRFHLTVWDGKGLDEDRPLWSCEDSPIMSRMDVFDALAENCGIDLSGESMILLLDRLRHHEQQNLGRVQERLGLLS